MRLAYGFGEAARRGHVQAPPEVCVGMRGLSAGGIGGELWIFFRGFVGLL